MSVTLVLGGARSGKSRHAESLAARHRGAKAYIATAEAIDEEMQARIAKHRGDRGDGWTTLEAPIDLAGAIAACKAPFILVDCLTLWLGNLLHYGRDADEAVSDLCAALSAARAHIVIVSNEVGLGIVPENEMARSFRDLQGFANQRLAELADEVVFIAAGLPLTLKAPRRRPASGQTAASGRGRRA
ncbi:MAG: bifunctional adenosylcobinamide kinase/adenosylcobinamide-phosphate guanylyltransferase [Rhizobiales bacterium]|nr:bifunctional adenosylcobinamide kinase/adenosylcobinamide-phosphate guanylyltransferase [Hyphomicrobiales bacterium]MBI3674517.1 bifunctional adenosylcobinamide kinase/adenosylcobinamide-phosphate guanylyltransferase [Hyphomicrobiales bacterium]